MVSSRDKVRAGGNFEPSADFHNAVVEAVQKIGQMSLTASRSEKPRESIEVYVQSASNISPGSVVGVGVPSIIASNASDAMTGVILEHAEPAEGKWMVARRGIYANAAGPCVLVGVAWAQVNVTNADHTHAEWAISDLASGESGYAKILYKPAGTGTSWCLLQLGCCGSGDGGGTSPASNCVCEIIQWLQNSGVASTTEELDALNALYQSCCVEGTGDCICGVIDWLIDSGLAASSQQLTALNQLKEDCGCEDPVEPGPCEDCTDIPETLPITHEGVVLSAGSPITMSATPGLANIRADITDACLQHILDTMAVPLTGNYLGSSCTWAGSQTITYDLDVYLAGGSFPEDGKTFGDYPETRTFTFELGAQLSVDSNGDWYGEIRLADKYDSYNGSGEDWNGFDIDFLTDPASAPDIPCGTKTGAIDQTASHARYNTSAGTVKLDY